MISGSPDFSCFSMARLISSCEEFAETRLTGMKCGYCRDSSLKFHSSADTDTIDFVGLDGNGICEGSGDAYFDARREGPAPETSLCALSVLRVTRRLVDIYGEFRR